MGAIKIRRKPGEFEAWQVGEDPKPEWVKEISEANHEPNLFIVSVALDEYQHWKVYAERGDYVVNDPNASDIAISPEEFDELYEVILNA